MTAKELIEKLSELPPESIVYLDDTTMPTCLGIAGVYGFVNTGFVVKTAAPIRIPTIVLSTYKYDHLLPE